MTHRHQWRRRPPWWPTNEPWPPAHRSEIWRHGRARFLRRIVLLFGAIVCLSALGVASLISMLIGGRGAGSLAFYLPSALIVTAASVLLLFLLFAGMRRFGVPLSNIVEGANRVANGEFSARVAECGPPSLRTVA